MSCILYIVQAMPNVTYTENRALIGQVIKTFYLNLASIYLKIHGHMDIIFKQNKFTQLTRYTFHRTTDHRQGPPRRPRYPSSLSSCFWSPSSMR